MENEKTNQEATSKESLAEMVSRLEKANQESKEILSKQEELAAQNLLGGRSEGSVQPVQKSEEEIKKEGAINFFKGSQVEDALKKYG